MLEHHRFGQIVSWATLVSPRATPFPGSARQRALGPCRGTESSVPIQRKVCGSRGRARACIPRDVGRRFKLISALRVTRIVLSNRQERARQENEDRLVPDVQLCCRVARSWNIASSNPGMEWTQPILPPFRVKFPKALDHYCHNEPPIIIHY